MTITVSADLAALEPEIRYVFDILSINKQEKIEYAFVSGTDVLVGTSNQTPVRISSLFLTQKLKADDLGDDGYFLHDDQRPDFFSTAFFYLACLQEIHNSNADSLGRFRFDGSVQQKHNTVLVNIVQRCLDELWRALDMKARSFKTAFFLSHDIDTVYAAIIEDGFNVIKKGRFDIFLSMLFQVAMGKPQWLNIDQIMKIESAYDCKSTFYWIVNKGKIDNVQVNADYSIREKKIRDLVSGVLKAGWDNGLHKSLANESFSEEVNKLAFIPAGNRYHYLKFSIPSGFDAVEQSGIRLDASLGFSEQWGFRNNYGMAYNPFNVRERRPYRFVEAPLHIMDRTFFARRISLNEVEKNIFDFFEAHRANCVLSVLWHNNFFTEFKYKGYLSLYKKILAYIRDNQLQTLSQEDIIKKYSLTWR